MKSMNVINTFFSFVTGNPLICNCAIVWLKSWLSESSSIGPKCADGTYVKGMPFSTKDCSNIPRVDDEFASCVTHENEALLPNLATSQVFSTIDKIKNYATQIKNNYHTNKINTRPSPEESDYFYDDYVDYPINETLIDGIKNEIGLNNKSHENIGDIPVLYAGTKNHTNRKPPSVAPTKPTSSFTFFGMPLPPIDVGKILNTGRKMDWPANKNAEGSKVYQVTEAPKFETGGFAPMLPTTSGGFMPIPDPTLTVSQTVVSNEGEMKYSKKGSTEYSIIEHSTQPTIHKVESNTTHQKIKSEIHELQAFIDDDNSTHVAYNRTKNIEQQNSNPHNLSKYNLMESNVTITQVTEKEGLLITTDTTNDISLQTWIASSTMSYSSASVTTKPIKKHIDESPTALSAVLIPNNADLIPKNFTKWPATITKVNIPHMDHEHRDRDTFSPVVNREAKTRFSDSMSLSNTRARDEEGKEWYYKNYNNTNLEPYIAPGVHSSIGYCTVSNSLMFIPVLLLKYNVMDSIY